jgi:small subunit ribosomal protein S2
MEELFSGLVSLKGIPDALVIVDPKKEENAVREANRLGVPIVAIQSTDCNALETTYPIVANDASRASIQFIIEKIAAAYRG